MLALFFEVHPKPERLQDYLDTAAKLKPALDATGGCLFIERFKSLRREGLLMSFQIWRDEAAMTAWRTNETHHKAQTLGRTQMFLDYRLRVAQVLREEEPGKPAWKAQRINVYNDPAHKSPRYMMAVQSTSADFLASEADFIESYASIYREGEFLHVVEIASARAGIEVSENCRIGAPAYNYRLCEIERDYGMFERAEAAQYYPEMQRKG
jgi:heme-degrading monooxygenase HmoA